MAPTPCQLCTVSRAHMIRPKDSSRLCKTCFITIFETEIHEAITSTSLFTRGERIAIGASGGKDSTVLASVLKTLNERHDYGLDLLLLSIDEGIKGYRDDSLETVKRNAMQYNMPLEIVSYDELYGWTMDAVVSQIGKKGNCTYCGVFRRQALDRGAARLGIKHVVTGHNADDVAETVLMNLLRGDLPRLARSTSIVTGNSASDIKRSKPLKYAYEKEIVMYALYKGLDYFSTECIYSPEAFRGSARGLVKDLERIRPSAILDLVRSGEDMAKLVPETLIGGGCVGEEEGSTGCGNAAGGRSSGRETRDMERQLTESAVAEARETEITIPVSSEKPTEVSATPRLQQSNSSNGVVSSSSAKPNSRPAKKKAGPRSKQKVQVMGRCKNCGYMSSQEFCKACMLLEGLNKNRPRRTVEIGVEEEDASSTVRRMVEGLSVAGG